ncbi:hypothetical protein [Pantoea ananatis]|uniref:hypothetical protein n=1 Tax=Pantoea ananas TaxID=553 RepID=UPI001F4DA15C|nr:hypothetical protein [Pantoea ananatis]MCH9271082.1 hypothetical protein [Pantoea ananatis]
MELTHSDLKEKHIKLVDTQWKLREKLQEKAAQLLQEYIASLSLNSSFWTDSEGNKRSYAEIGEVNSSGEFLPVPFPRLGMDKDYKVNFVLATVMDDSPMTGGARHGVNISLMYADYRLWATVGSGDDAVAFPVSEADGGFFEVCAAIKAMINYSLDSAMPKVSL